MHTAEKNLDSTQYLPYAAISETTAKVIGNQINDLETFQHFKEKGSAVKGGNAIVRVWEDKTYVPVTLNTQCIDCLHCVVACPHSSIQYEIKDKDASGLVMTAKELAKLLPGFHLSESTV